MTFDPMHDLLEGVVSMCLKRILNDMVNGIKIITDVEVNERILRFDYGTAEKKDKPCGNFKSQTLKTKNNKFTDVSLKFLDAEKLSAMGIVAIGPRLIVLSVVDKMNKWNDPMSEDMQSSALREILECNKKFRSILYEKLDAQIIPTDTEIKLMIRILCATMVERLMHDSMYPTWQQKQELALKILEEFPHLETTRVSENAPKESYFFWRNGGLSRGQHTGLIETRVSKMRKDVLPENRQFRRTKKETIVLKDGCVQLAAFLSGLLPTPANARQISEGMIQTTDLHKLLLQKSKSNEIVSTFPHLLSYEGEMVIQAFDRIHEKNIQDTGDLKMLLRAGILFDNSSWNMIQDDFIKGALRLMKKISNKGIKRTTGMENNASMEEITAAPIIKWIRFPHSEVGFDEMLAVKQLSSTIGDSHIICAGELPWKYVCHFQ
ncbi:uncharacterized protein LOC131428951 [Malaya genurostris]|uniref:uncharacterized protein LOC131428951 n=1 Tax=Malaya genurostris TaxID=325434 RepID=UPI0026F40079|nr:uncharacterized protein LOC131428951 [Malaya genurostris]